MWNNKRVGEMGEGAALAARLVKTSPLSACQAPLVLLYIFKSFMTYTLIAHFSNIMSHCILSNQPLELRKRAASFFLKSNQR